MKDPYCVYFSDNLSMFSCTHFAVGFIALENHRVAEVGRHHRLRSSGPTPPVQGRITYKRLLRAMSHQLLSISKDRNSTTCSVFGHPYDRKGSSYFSREFPVLPFMPFASGPVTGHHREECGSVFFAPTIRYLYIIPWRLLFSRLNTYGSLSPSSYETCSNQLVVLWPIAGLSPVCPYLVLGSPELDTAPQVWS